MSSKERQTARPVETRIDEVKLEIGDFLRNNGWRRFNCARCHSLCFAKAPNPESTCDSMECTGYKFLEKPRAKKPPGIGEIVRGFRTHFGNHGYKEANPIPIVSNIGTTLFTGTGTQIFDRAIFMEDVVLQKPHFVAQPVIRLQEVELVGKVDGFATSFVNLSTEHVNSSLQEHITHIDNWLSLLSRLKLYMGDFTLKFKEDNPTWGDIQLDALTIKLNYMGLEIGVANYFLDIPQTSRESLTISDLSFGLERIAWAINKTQSYFDIIGPLILSALNKHVYMDSYRTMTLMAASGVKPANSDRGSKFRMLAKKVSQPCGHFLEDLVRYYYGWWGRFTEFPISQNETVRRIRREWNRNVNIVFQEKLGGNRETPIYLDPEDYLKRLVENGIDTGAIRRVFSTGGVAKK